MCIELILNTPNIFTGDYSQVSVSLKSEDYENKTIKQVVAEHAFTRALQGQDPAAAKQAINLLFTLIQPEKVADVEQWWGQPFSSLILNDSKKVEIRMEYNEAGIEFINQNM